MLQNLFGLYAMNVCDVNGEKHLQCNPCNSNQCNT